MSDKQTKTPGSVLFACNLNAVRSPMAEGLARAMLGGARVASVGVYAAELDPFASEAVRDLDVDISAHTSRDFQAVNLADYDLVIALTPEAEAEARAHGAPGLDIERWEIENPSGAAGSRDQILEAYKAVRDDLAARIAARFGVSAPERR